MKSIRYILGGRPYKFADCLDLSRRVQPESVTLHLRSAELPREHEPMTQFIADIDWAFPDQTIRTETVCGSSMASDTAEGLLYEARRADEYLACLLARIEQTGPTVRQKDQHFEPVAAETAAR